MPDITRLARRQVLGAVGLGLAQVTAREAAGLLDAGRLDGPDQGELVLVIQIVVARRNSSACSATVSGDAVRHGARSTLRGSGRRPAFRLDIPVRLAGYSAPTRGRGRIALRGLAWGGRGRNAWSSRDIGGGSCRLPRIRGEPGTVRHCLAPSRHRVEPGLPCRLPRLSVLLKPCPCAASLLRGSCSWPERSWPSVWGSISPNGMTMSLGTNRRRIRIRRFTTSITRGAQSS